MGTGGGQGQGQQWCAPPCSTNIGGRVAKISGGGGVRRRGLRTIGSFSCDSVVTSAFEFLGVIRV